METHSDEEITEASARDLPATLLNLRVVDGRTYEIMAAGVQLLRKARKFFVDRAQPRIDDANKLHKNLIADLRKDTDPIDEAQKYGDNQLSAYDTEQTRLADLEAARLKAEQKKREDDEKMQLAELAEKAGEKELAAEILDAPSTEPMVAVQKAVPRVAGIHFTEKWDYEITAWEKIPARFHRMEANPKGEWSCKCIKDIGIEVERLKETANIPGVRVFKRKITYGRG